MVDLFQHHWLTVRRSSYWQKSIILNIILATTGICFLLNVVMISWSADEMLRVIYDTSDTIPIFSGYFLLYFLVDFANRFIMQKISMQDIKPYLTLAISKQKLAHYVLVKSLLGFFSILALCLIIPYFIRVIVTNASPLFSFVWLTSVLSLVILNNFSFVVLKWYYAQHPLIVAVVMLSIGTLLFLNYSALVTITGYFSVLLLWITAQSWRLVFPLLIIAISYTFAYRAVRKQMYAEEGTDGKTKRYDSFSFLNNCGQVTDLVAIELKMLWRNKRSKSSILFGLFFMAYGAFLYLHNFDSGFMPFIISLWIVASFPMMYGQSLFSWESSYFGFYLSNKISYIAYLKAKYLVFGSLSLIAYALAFPLALWHTELYIIHTACLLYMIGVGSIFVIVLGCLKGKRIRLDRSQIMNYEGISIVDFIIIIPIIGIPLLLYFGLDFFGQADYAIYVLGALGAGGLMLHPILLNMVLRIFEKRRYKMAEGFLST